MKPRIRRNPFASNVAVVKPFNEKQAFKLFKDKDTATHHPMARMIRRSVAEGLTRWCQYGMYETHEIVGQEAIHSLAVPSYLRSSFQLEKMMERGQYSIPISEETTSFLTPGKSTDFFLTVPSLIDSKEYIPDTTYLDFMVSTPMQLERESRKTWDAQMNWRLMKEVGSVKYGSLATFDWDMTNEEWGAGMELFWTWMETNMFGINLARFAPKFKFDAFDKIADMVYGLFVAAATRTLATFGLTASNQVIHDINQAEQAFIRWKNQFGKFQFANASFRIVSCPENWWFLDRALRASETVRISQVAENFFRRPSVTYTTKLTTPNEFYLVVDKHEQNEYGTRIPLTSYGPEDDIERFASVVTGRHATGANFNPYSIIKLSFNPALDTFGIQEPILIKG